MSKVRIVDSSNETKLRKKSAEILEIYNDSINWHQDFNLKAPEYCYIAYIKGVRGGVQLEMLQGKYGIIYFAGFEEKDRGKGYARKCVDALSKILPVYGVQVDFGDTSEIWQKMGFKHESMLNMCQTLLNIPEDEFNSLIPQEERLSNFEFLARHFDD